MFKVFTKNESYRQSQRLLLCKKLDFSIFNCYRYKSHYKSLGLNSDATPKEIKSAYYDLSLKFHPDKNKGSAESTEKFREITEAYEVLGNAEKKRIYDEDLNARYSESTWRRENYSPRSDSFRSRSEPRTGRTQHYNYDEHYRKHYEDYSRHQNIDYEYLRRRWEAEFRRRHPFSDDEYYTRYRWRRQERAYDEHHEYRMHKIKVTHSKAFVYFVTIWILLSLFSLPFMEDYPRTPKSIYYKVNSNDDSSSSEK